MRRLTITQPNLGDLSLEDFLWMINRHGETQSEETSSLLTIDGSSCQEAVYENWAFLAVTESRNEYQK